jgi:FkbM family methyltransferase
MSSSPKERLIRRLSEEGLSGLIYSLKSFIVYPPLPEFLFVIRELTSCSTLVTKKIQGSFMLIDLSKLGIHRDLFLYGIREPTSTKILKNELREGMFVLDIGANIGYYALIEAKIVKSHGHVWAIEPSPDNAWFIKQNIAMNKLDNVTVHKVAIGDEIGTVYLNICEDSPNLNRVSLPTTNSSTKRIPVEIITLDEFMRKNNVEKVDFIRFDVEGFEYRIIKGGKNTLNKYSPYIFVEIHPTKMKEYNDTLEMMLKELSEFDYYIKYLIWEPSKVPNKLLEASSSLVMKLDVPVIRCLEKKELRILLRDGAHLFLY